MVVCFALHFKNVKTFLTGVKQGQIEKSRSSIALSWLCFSLSCKINLVFSFLICQDRPVTIYKPEKLRTLAF